MTPPRAAAAAEEDTSTPPVAVHDTAAFAKRQSSSARDSNDSYKPAVLPLLPPQRSPMPRSRSWCYVPTDDSLVNDIICTNPSQRRYSDEVVLKTLRLQPISTQATFHLLDNRHDATIESAEHSDEDVDYVDDDYIVGSSGVASSISTANKLRICPLTNIDGTNTSSYGDTSVSTSADDISVSTSAADDDDHQQQASAHDKPVIRSVPHPHHYPVHRSVRSRSLLSSFGLEALPSMTNTTTMTSLQRRYSEILMTWTLQDTFNPKTILEISDDDGMDESGTDESDINDVIAHQDPGAPDGV